jgi:hypothetical protein
MIAKGTGACSAHDSCSASCYKVRHINQHRKVSATSKPLEALCFCLPATTVCPSFAGYDSINGSLPVPTHVPTTFWAFTPAGNPAFPHVPPAQKLADI